MTSATACDDIAIAPQPTVDDLTLTDDQSKALAEIEAAERAGDCYLLTGYAGSGKTTLMQAYAKRAVERKKRIVLSAPTHKAVAVLRRKVEEAEQDVPCCTIHSLLSLKPKPHGDRLVFDRDKWAEPVTADIVVIDECSMIDRELFRHIKRHLPTAFVLFVGDPAQLPPVNEIASETFGTKGHSHLSTIVRQAAGNPILEAASIIRQSQGGAADWSWCRQSSLDTGHGVFVPGSAANRWMQKAFTSKEFEDDPDSFRYLAWTNRRVAEVNDTVRQWRYGDYIPTPFMPGERAMFRAPVVIDKTVIFATNEEAVVTKIERAVFRHEVPKADRLPSWNAQLPAWRVTLKNSEGTERTVYMPDDEREFNQIVAAIKDEAADSRIRWRHLHEFKSSLARLQSIYSMTVHCSQGSTFTNAFVDVPDIRNRERSNLLETTQLCYVAATRPRHRLILVGV